MTLSVKIKKLRPTTIPCYMTDQAAGVDLHAALEREFTLHPGERALVPTGIALEIPPGYEAQVRPRSGLALRHGIALVNSPVMRHSREYLIGVKKGSTGLIFFSWRL